MRRLALLCVLLAGSALAGESIPTNAVGVATYSPTCSPLPPGVTEDHCFELIVQSLDHGAIFDVLSVGPGGRVCGPATVRTSKDGRPALTVDAGVCIPAETK